MPRLTYGSAVKERVKHLLTALLSLINGEFDESNHKIDLKWQAEDSPRPKLIVRARLMDLESLTEKNCYGNPKKLNKEQIREAITILRDFLEILEDNRVRRQGSQTWHFTLALWSTNKEKNLKQFDEAWEIRRTEKFKKLEERFHKNSVTVSVEPFNYMEIPEGSVSLDSPFYIERSPIESYCYKTILQPGALIRIKAPPQFGKTSLLQRILHSAKQNGHQTAYLSLQSADAELLTNLDQFLQWLCTSITDELNIDDRREDYWKKGIGSKQKCSNYFQRYLLATFTQPLTLALDEVDLVFQYPKIAQEFFSLLRYWNEKSRNETVWEKLRLVIASSQEIYISLNTNQSPFNVGSFINLPEFNQVQISELVRRYGLNLSTSEIEKLIEMVDGHPYLLKKALYEIAGGFLNLEQFLQIAATEEGPYGDHLRHHLLNLGDAGLKVAMKQVVGTSGPVRLEPNEAFKLHSMGLELNEAFKLHNMGLVKLRGNDVVPLCNLYRLYFRNRLEVDL